MTGAYSFLKTSVDFAISCTVIADIFSALFHTAKALGGARWEGLTIDLYLEDFAGGATGADNRRFLLTDLRSPCSLSQCRLSRSGTSVGTLKLDTS